MGARVMVMAGGTGGHVFPALAVAHELSARGLEVFWLGSRDGFEMGVVPDQGFRVEAISIRGLRGNGLRRWLAAPFSIALALWQALRILRRNRPRLVLGMGGFVTGPGGLMARLLGIPLVIHEQNAVAGLTNRLLARVANRVLEAFPGSFGGRRGVQLTGNPVRAAIAALPPFEQRAADRSGPPRLLVLGGSQGAQPLNELLPAALALLPGAQRPLVRHQAGRDKALATEQGYRAAGIDAEVTPFLDDMAEAYGWADLVVCRAGALTIAELAAAGVGALLIPYPHAVDDHQTRNAAYLADGGAARLLPQRELDAGRLAEALRPLLADRARCAELARAARRLALPQATAQVADICLQEVA